MIIRLPLPEKLHGENLRRILVQAGYENVVVGEDDGELEIQAEKDGRQIDERDRLDIEPLVRDHPTEPVGEEREVLDADKKLRELEAKDTLTDEEVLEAVRAMLRLRRTER